MTIYLVQTYYSEPAAKAFTCRVTALAYRDQINRFKNGTITSSFIEIELVTDQFMEQILQPKESHETNTNSSL